MTASEGIQDSEVTQLSYRTPTVGRRTASANGAGAAPWAAVTFRAKLKPVTSQRSVLDTLRQLLEGRDSGSFVSC